MCWILSDVSPKYFLRTLNQAYILPTTIFGSSKGGEEGKKNQPEEISLSQSWIKLYLVHSTCMTWPDYASEYRRAPSSPLNRSP